jgi:hypothetical protein
MLTELGPSFIKFGQAASIRPGILEFLINVLLITGILSGQIFENSRCRGFLAVDLLDHYLRE